MRADYNGFLVTVLASVDFARDFTKDALRLIYKTLDDKDYSEKLEILNKY